MFKIYLHSVGKNKEQWLSDALSIYQRRLNKQVQLDFHWHKSNAAMEKALEKEKLFFCFDPKGKMLNSEEFAHTLKDGLIKGGSQLALVIGEAKGLSSKLKKSPLICFSPMVFTHQLSRLIVVEQLYRSVQIWNNSPYHFS